MAHIDLLDLPRSSGDDDSLPANEALPDILRECEDLLERQLLDPRESFVRDRSLDPLQDALHQLGRRLRRSDIALHDALPSFKELLYRTPACECRNAAERGEIIRQVVALLQSGYEMADMELHLP